MAVSLAQADAILAAGRGTSMRLMVGYMKRHDLRWLLDAGDDVAVRQVDLDEAGYTGLVILEMAGVRAVIESGNVSRYRWDEHTRIYFQHGWVKAWAPPLLLKNVPADGGVLSRSPGPAGCAVVVAHCKGGVCEPNCSGPRVMWIW